MAQTTSIEWTDVSWNPVHGCSRVSTGCLHCYAETLSLRYGQTTVPWTKGNEQQNVMLKPHKLREPLSKAGPWKDPCRVFVNSMSDLFHEEIPVEYIAQVFAVMARAERHTFQVLTKRPGRMRDLLRSHEFLCLVDDEREALTPGCGDFDWPLPNVWLGVSVENRKWVGRADELRATPAAVRFVSAEPLLGPLVYDSDIGMARDGWPVDLDDDHHGIPEHLRGDPYTPAWEDGADLPELDLDGIDWLIVGGESGASHRRFDPEWARDLRDACEASGTAFFMKQMGGARPGTKLEDLPEDLRVREFPAVAR